VAVCKATWTFCHCHRDITAIARKLAHLAGNLLAAVPEPSDPTCREAFREPVQQVEKQVGKRDSRVIAMACLAGVAGLLALLLAALAVISRVRQQRRFRAERQASLTPSNEVASAAVHSGRSDRGSSAKRIHSTRLLDASAQSAAVRSTAGGHGSGPPPPPRELGVQGRRPGRISAPTVPTADVLPRSRSI
jgi:hypothetical protein